MGRQVARRGPYALPQSQFRSDRSKLKRRVRGTRDGLAFGVAGGGADDPMLAAEVALAEEIEAATAVVKAHVECVGPRVERESLGIARQLGEEHFRRLPRLVHRQKD